MKPSVLILAAAVGLAMTEIGAQAATLRQNAVCAVSESADIVAERLLRQGDQEAFQMLIDSNQIRFLNGKQIDVLSGIANSYYLAIRVFGTFDVYYTYYTNVIGSDELDAQVAAFQKATQDAEAFSRQLEAQTAELEAQNAEFEGKQAPVSNPTPAAITVINGPMTPEQIHALINGPK